MNISNLYANVEKLKNSLLGRSEFAYLPGYRMTVASNARWDRIEREKMRTQKQWEETERREHEKQVIVNKARQMIERAVQEYQSAVLMYQKKGNIRTLKVLRLDWSPQRVLSTYKDFARLCDALRDEEIWKLLSRKERAFVADAVGLKK